MSSTMIAVVTPLRDKNHGDVLHHAMASVVRAVGADPAASWIIVDNGSRDGSDAVAAAHAPAARLLRSSALTIAAARNEGASSVPGDLLVFLDADVLVPLDFFARVRAVMEDAGIDASGCEVGLPPQPHWVEATWFLLNTRPGTRSIHYVNSACFVVRRRAFQSVGGFDDRLVTGEDTDICRRLADSGYRLVQDERLRVGHLDNPRSVSAFARKSYWHGLGIFGAGSRRVWNRTGILTAMHGTIMASAAAATALGVAPWWVLLLAPAAMPAALVSLRLPGRHPWPKLGAALLLSSVFLASRVAAMARVLLAGRGASEPA